MDKRLDLEDNISMDNPAAFVHASSRMHIRMPFSNDQDTVYAERKLVDMYNFHTADLSPSFQTFDISINLKYIAHF